MNVNFNNFSSFIDILGRGIDELIVKEFIKNYGLDFYENSDSAYFENPKIGIELSCEGQVVVAVFLHAEGKDDFYQYEGELIEGLKFSSKSEDVKKLLGEPASHGISSKIEGLEHGCWIKYQFREFFLHFSFNIETDELELITFMPRDKTGAENNICKC